MAHYSTTHCFLLLRSRRRRCIVKKQCWGGRVLLMALLKKTAKEQFMENCISLLDTMWGKHWRYPLWIIKCLNNVLTTNKSYCPTWENKSEIPLYPQGSQKGRKVRRESVGKSVTHLQSLSTDSFVGFVRLKWFLGWMDGNCHSTS